MFDGEETYLEIPLEVDEISRFTFVSVFQSTDSLEERGVWGSKNSQRSIMLTTQRVSGPEKILSYSGGKVSIPVLNTTVQYWGKTKAGNLPTSILLGNAGENNNSVKPFRGLIPEYLVFKKILREEERRRVESYLAIKYGLTLPSSDYVNSESEVIWDNKKNKAYSNRIAGIGRDDYFGLYQKQSSSTAEPGILTIGANKIVTSNLANTAEFSNLDFLLWGDNGEAFDLQEDVGKTQQPFAFLTRKWQMVTAGTSAYTIPTQVMVSVSRISIPKGFKPWLVIDRSGKGIFHSYESEYVELSSITQEGQAIFNDARWDTDLSGKDVFTFAIGPDKLPFIGYFNIYSNPSPGDFNIDISLKENSDISVDIYSINGQLIKTLIGKAQSEYRFKDRLINNGVYLIKLRTKEGILTKELVITN